MGRPAARTPRRDDDPADWPDWVLKSSMGRHDDRAIMAAIWRKHDQWKADRAAWMEENGVTLRQLSDERSRRQMPCWETM